MHRDAGDFLLGEPAAQRDRFPRAAGAGAAPLEPLQVIVGQRDQLTNAVQGVVQVRALFHRQFQGEVRPVHRQDFAVAVGDQAARRRHRLGQHPVVVTKGGEPAVLGDLQPGHAPDQYQRQHQNQRYRHQQTQAEQTVLVMVVLEGQRLAHVDPVTGSAPGRRGTGIGTKCECGSRMAARLSGGFAQR